VALSIKSEEASKLAREVAELTGETLTTAVTVALEERVKRLRRERDAGLKERLMAIAKDAGARWREPYKSIDHGELLYDERGLPREGPLLDFERRPPR
jgi:antitoxin VapB